MYLQVFCDIYGDFELINEDYDGTEVGYAVTYSCDRFREDIGSGAQTFAATLIAALAAFLLLNWKVSKAKLKHEIKKR